MLPIRKPRKRVLALIVALLTMPVSSAILSSPASAMIALPPGPTTSLDAVQPADPTQKAVTATVPPSWAGSYFVNSYELGYAATPDALDPTDTNVQVVSTDPAGTPLDAPTHFVIDTTGHAPGTNLYLMIRAHLQGDFTGLWSTPLLVLGPGDAPPPPVDNKQHGVVAGVSWSVSPTTPSWILDVSADLTNVSCPASLIVTVGTWEKRPRICGVGETAPSTLRFGWKVFDPSRSLSPGSNVPITAYVARSKEAHYGTTLLVPQAPPWAGLGDSYSSGHHQDKDDIGCVPQDLPIVGPCHPASLTENDPAFSWVTRAVAKLNTGVPAIWKYKELLLAQSGVTTGQMFDQGQVRSMARTIANLGQTWSIVSLTGGANNVDFLNTLRDFYQGHLSGKPKPWNVTNWSDCPDTQALYNRLLNQKATIRSDLSEIVAQGRAASSSVRFVDMLYPYVLKSDNVCNVDRQIPDPNDLTKSLTWHGAGSVIDELDKLHLEPNGSDVTHVDPRNIFGPNPLPEIQKTRYFGYPHPDDSGQAKMASAAIRALR